MLVNVEKKEKRSCFSPIPRVKATILQSNRNRTMTCFVENNSIIRLLYREKFRFDNDT